MPVLIDRFREIEVIVEEPAISVNARDWPPTWLPPESSTALVRFVETQFEQERTTMEIRQTFGNAARISVRPMSLRSIFLTIARNSSEIR
jgi:hypothetical protein